MTLAEGIRTERGCHPAAFSQQTMNTLSISVVVVLALGVAQAHFDWEKAEKAFNACKAETKAEETFEEVGRKEIIPTSKNGKCLIECLLRAKGINDKDGKYSKEGSRNYFNKVFSHNPKIIDKVVAIADECSKIDHKDKCETAVNHVNCAKAKYSEEKINVHE